MIEPNELRIGNYINSNISCCNCDKGLVKVDFDIFNKIKSQNALSHLEPIPITEQWLIDLGLELLYGQCYRIVEDDYEELDNFICIQKKINYWSVYIHSDYKKVDIELSNIQYIHQFQNLYFDLSRKELTKQ